MATETELNELVRQFQSRLSGLKDLTHEVLSLGHLRTHRDWSPWAGHRGIYYFLRPTPSGREVVYVGVAALGDLGHRVWDQMRIRGTGAWDTFVSDPENFVGIIAFHNDDWYWPLSLEAFLIRELQPEFNYSGSETQERVGKERAASRFPR